MVLVQSRTLGVTA